MLSKVINVNKHVKIHNQRLVYSNVCNNGVSVNWRADWARYQGKSYAQVVKSNINPPHRSRVLVSPRVISDSFKNKHVEHVFCSNVAPVSPPVHTQVKKPLTKKLEKIVNTDLQGPIAPRQFVCTTANRFAALAINTDDTKEC